jgi:hypothetical protein
MVANGLYDELDALRLLYGSEFVEEVLDGIIDRKRRLNRLVELKSKVIVTVDEQTKFIFLSGYSSDTSTTWREKMRKLGNSC